MLCQVPDYLMKFLILSTNQSACFLKPFELVQQLPWEGSTLVAPEVFRLDSIDVVEFRKASNPICRGDGSRFFLTADITDNYR